MGIAPQFNSLETLHGVGPNPAEKLWGIKRLEAYAAYGLDAPNCDDYSVSSINFFGGGSDSLRIRKPLIATVADTGTR
ncbi:hypothetical protein LF1_29800 [Rubripirellula obstinata]|uniref:Uncharacterized protein n=1 Tax=Rubripirellula obstinata TaxID=406547 RepID=A0A5B1CLM9_9BACT|nr:hypothetical protein LF1_29800 [Rubripirellula obstinata]